MSDILHDLIPQYVEGGTIKTIETLHGGLINATYLVEIEGSDEPLVFQRVNTAVFNKPELVMTNIKLVTKHLKEVAPTSRNLHLEHTHDGASYILDGRGGLWRAFNYLSGCIGYENVQTPQQAYESGRAFGGFLSQMKDLDAAQLEEIIPSFHHTPSRYEALEEAVKENLANRAGIVTRQLDFIRERKGWMSRLEDLRQTGELPTRTTHNDTKISNVLFDERSDQAVCVIDLDTVMPGTMLYDFGDLVRTSVNRVPEDAPEDEVTCDLELFSELSRGYLEQTAHFLTPAETENLVFSAKLITLELAMRFLTDYLNGDQYFRVSRETQNLERARNQLKLVERIEEHEAEMKRAISRFL